MSPIKILADATLPDLCDLFRPPFELTYYHSADEVPDLLKEHQILVCRSTLTVNTQLLTGSAIRYVATASSGTDHLDIGAFSKRGIKVIDAKGCNARSVADYVVSTLAFLYQHHAVHGQKAGIIGVGEVGSRVVKRLASIGFDVVCYDPFKARAHQTYNYVDLSDLSSCDVLCIHANLHDTAPFPSMNLLSTDFLSGLKENTLIINASRGGIVNEEALLNNKAPLVYCTDVYTNEPILNPKLTDYATLCTPHIAGHSIEAKKNALSMLSKKIHAIYGIATQPTPKPHAISAIPKALMSWQDIALHIYNPIKDTQILKAATDKTAAFLNQRKAHQYRHDFNLYELSALDELDKNIMGA